MAIEAFDGPLPDGWQGGEAITKRWNGDFIHLYRVHRPCATCTAKISIDVTKKALQGFSRNAGLNLRNCPTCRAAKKNGGPGSRGGKSRPVADAPPLVLDDMEALRMANNVMKEEIDGLYAINAELRARLAQYEIQPAMEEIARAKKPSLTFPWSGR